MPCLAQPAALVPCVGQLSAPATTCSEIRESGEIGRPAPPNWTNESSYELSKPPEEKRCLVSAMALAPAPLLFSTPPISFHGFLRDALVALALPYGPQLRERLAALLPEVFGRSSVTLSGYSRWLARTNRVDTADTFAEYVEVRYQRWRAALLKERSLGGLG